MSEDFIDDVRSSFLLPWEVKLNSLLSAAGHQVVNGPDIFFPGSPLEQARDVIIELIIPTPTRQTALLNNF